MSEQQRGVWRDNSEGERTTLREALDRYEREITGRKRGEKQERSTLRTLRASRIAPLTLARIGSHDIAGLRDQWRSDGLAAGTIKRKMTVLKHLFSTARIEWSMPGLNNPVKDIKLDPVDDTRERRVTDAEIEAICAATGSDALPAIVRLLVATACRRTELVRMPWSIINLQTKMIYIPKGFSKSGRRRKVPISEAALGILRALPRYDHGRLFDVQPGSVTQAFERAAERAGIEDIRIHDLRHEAISRLALLYNVLDLAKIVDHNDPKMLMRYYHPGDEYLADKID